MIYESLRTKETIRQSIAVFSFAMIMLFSRMIALGCSCAAMPTVLDSFNDSSLVVITHMVSVDKIAEKQGEYDIHYLRSVNMVVDKAYKGNVKVGDELTFAQGGGSDCVWTFDESWIGHKYLFYLGPATKGHPWMQEDKGDLVPMYYAIACGRSRGIDAAASDISFLDNIDKLRNKTRLSGQYDSWYSNAPSFAGLKLKIIGKTKTYEAKTDKSGFYEIYDLPPGDYVVEPQIPFGWKINNYMLEKSLSAYDRYRSKQLDSSTRITVTIEAKRHTLLDLTFDMDTAIRGRILSPAGKPMKDVCVKAVSTELKEGDYRGHFDCSNDKGEFSIEEMGPDNYVLVVNDDGRMNGNHPFGVVFYPGVSDYKNAGIVKVELGKYVTGLDIQIPTVVELVEIKGKFLYSNGSPVVDESVVFEPSDRKRFDTVRVRSDAAGGFTFRLPNDDSGTVRGEMYTYLGEFKNCPKFDSLIAATGKTYLTAQTDPFSFDGLTPTQLIELKFPFPSCQKSPE